MARLTARSDRLARTIDRAFAPAPARVGVVVTSRGAPVGTIVLDDRELHGAACRGCDWCAYDVRSAGVLTRGLVGHLVAEHGIDARTLDADTRAVRAERRLGPLLARTVETVVRSGRRQLPDVRGAA